MFVGKQRDEQRERERLERERRREERAAAVETSSTTPPPTPTTKCVCCSRTESGAGKWFDETDIQMPPKSQYGAPNAVDVLFFL